jgi:hypothetical protein
MHIAHRVGRRFTGDSLMADKHTSVFGIYPGAIAADSGVETLVHAGFPIGSVSVLLSDASSRELGHEKHTKAPEGAAAGGTAGGVLGGTIGLLAGIGVIALPGLGALIAAGPLMAALAGLGAGSAVGGVLGALSGLGIPEYEAKRYEGRVKTGGVLLSVHCDSPEQIERAKALLKDTGADDISSADESKSRPQTVR